MNSYNAFTAFVFIFKIILKVRHACERQCPFFFILTVHLDSKEICKFVHKLHLFLDREALFIITWGLPGWTIATGLPLKTTEKLQLVQNTAEYMKCLELILHYCSANCTGLIFFKVLLVMGPGTIPHWDGYSKHGMGPILLCCHLRGPESMPFS